MEQDVFEPIEEFIRTTRVLWIRKNLFCNEQTALYQYYSEQTTLLYGRSFSGKSETGHLMSFTGCCVRQGNMCKGPPSSLQHDGSWLFTPGCYSYTGWYNCSLQGLPQVVSLIMITTCQYENNFNIILTLECYPLCIQ